jgi:hypothetical protein
VGKTHRLSRAWKRWRENRRQYQIERALYKQGGGERALRTPVERISTQGTDPSKLSDD